MKISQFRYIILGLLAIMSTVSCKKYLAEKSDSAKVVPSTIEDVQALLDNTSIMNQNSTPAISEVASDDLFIMNAVYNASPAPVYLWEEHIYNHSNDWSKIYNIVYTANLSLEILDKTNRQSNNESTWNNAKGSALFFRANSYLQLVWAFGKAYNPQTSSKDLGIVLRSGSDFNVPSVRSSVSDAYERIISDLKEAIPLLPNNPSNPMRPSKAATYATLARTYLSMRNYEEMHKYTDLALQIKSDLVNYNNASDVGSGNVPFKAYPYNKEVIFYSHMYSTVLNYKSPNNSFVDSLLYTMYELNDKRKTVFFRANSGYQKFKGNYAGHATNLFTGIAVDELYLMRAEGHARAGRVTEALADLNTLLRNRYQAGFINKIAATQEAVLELIFKERRKELLMRGLRWMDVKRRNEEDANIVMKRIINGKTYTLQPKDNRYALPLPDDIIKITGMPQNPM